MATKIHTSININATPQQVWDVLMNFKEYPQWNPFIQSITGIPKVGHTIKVNLTDMTFTPLILKQQQYKELRWKGQLWLKGIFDGEHYFILSPNEQGGTLFEHGEIFSGLLVALVKNKVIPNTTQGFKTMNEALKQRVENLNLSVSQ